MSIKTGTLKEISFSRHLVLYVCYSSDVITTGGGSFSVDSLTDSVAIRLSSNQRWALGTFVAVCAGECEAKMRLNAQRKKSAKKEREIKEREKRARKRAHKS